MTYYEKYIKYKNKYTNLKNQFGGLLMGSLADLRLGGYTGDKLYPTIDNFFYNNDRFISNSIEINDKNLYQFLMLLNTKKNNSYIDDNGKFNDKFFSLQNNYNHYQTRPYTNNVSFILCKNKIAHINNNRILSNLNKITIKKNNDTYELLVDNKTEETNKNLEELLKKKYMYNYGSMKDGKNCQSFKTEDSNGTLLNEPLLYLSSNSDDILNISSNIQIILSRNILIYNNSILFNITNLKEPNGNISFDIISTNEKFININPPYNNSIENLFSKITDGINNNLRSQLGMVAPYNYIENLPFNFYHVHLCSPISERLKLILIVHAKIEDPGDNETYSFTKPDGKKTNITKLKWNVDNDPQHNQKLVAHNHIVVIDLNNINKVTIKIKTLNYNEIIKPKIEQELKRSKLFNTHYISFAYNIFGLNFGGLNYHIGNKPIITLKSKLKSIGELKSKNKGFGLY